MRAGKKIILVRHGSQGEVQGIGAPVSQEGIKQVNDLAPRLPQLTDATIYTSTTQRAVTTAQILAQRLRIKRVKRVPEFQDHVAHDLLEKPVDPQVTQLRRRLRRKHRVDLTEGTNEDSRIFETRVMGAFSQIARKMGDALIVTHGRVIETLLWRSDKETASLPMPDHSKFKDGELQQGYGLRRGEAWVMQSDGQGGFTREKIIERHSDGPEREK